MLWHSSTFPTLPALGGGLINWLRTSEAAERLNVSEKTVYNWLRSGRLDGWKLGRIWMISEDALSALMAPPARTDARRGQGEALHSDPADFLNDIKVLRRFTELAEGAILNGISAILSPRYVGPNAGTAVDQALENATGDVMIAGVGLPEFFNDQGRHAYTIRRMKQEDRPVRLRALLVDPLGKFASARATLEADTNELSENKLRVSPLYVSALRSVQVLRSLANTEDGANFELQAKFAGYWPSVHLVLTNQICFVEIYHFGPVPDGEVGGRSAPVPVLAAASHSSLYIAMRQHFEYVWSGVNPLISLRSPQDLENSLQSTMASN